LNFTKSMRNIENGMLEIVVHNGRERACSNGLLISDNGYFLTAKHCVDFPIGLIEVRNGDGSAYKIDKICAVSNKGDFALVKAKMMGRYKTKKYNFFNMNKLKSRIPIRLLTIKKGILKDYFGFVQDLFYNP